LDDFDPALIGEMEARVLEAERRTEGLGRDLRDLARGLAGLGQGVWDGWSDFRTPVGVVAPPPPAAPCTPDFANVCPCIPTTLTVTDSLTGTTTITYDSTNLWWIGCKIYSRPSNATCTARNIPVWFQLYGQTDTSNWQMYCRWFAPNNGNVCPTLSKTCSDNVFGTGGVFRLTVALVTCAGGVFAASGAFDWVNQNQVGLPGTISSFTVA
jgi:hypothetical protein